MGWHTGLQRLRLVGTAALALGAVACISVLLTRGLGYAPNSFVEPLFDAMWPIGLVFVVLGALLWVAVWVLHGFLPPAALAVPTDPTPRRAQLEDARPDASSHPS